MLSLMPALPWSSHRESILEQKYHLLQSKIIKQKHLSSFKVIILLGKKKQYLLKWCYTPRIVQLLWLTCYNQTSNRI